MTKLHEPYRTAVDWMHSEEFKEDASEIMDKIYDAIDNHSVDTSVTALFSVILGIYKDPASPYVQHVIELCAASLNYEIEQTPEHADTWLKITELFKKHYCEETK